MSDRQYCASRRTVRQVDFRLGETFANDRTLRGSGNARGLALVALVPPRPGTETEMDHIAGSALMPLRTGPMTGGAGPVGALRLHHPV